MSSIKNLKVNSPDIIGEVFVQPPGNVPPVLTLFLVNSHKYGKLLLVDHDGVAVLPKSPKLRNCLLVCEDGTDPKTILAAGYRNVVTRG